MLDTDLSIKLYQSISDSREERPMSAWHPSSICACPRASYFKRLGIPELEVNRPSAAKLLRWSAGHHLETAIREHIQNLYPDVISNEKLESKEWDLRGEYDNYSPKEKTLIEIKSVDDFAFIERDGELTLKEQSGFHPNGNKKWEAKNEPYLHHILQNHAYALMLRELGKEVETIKFVYLALKGRICSYSVPVEEKYLEAVKRRLTTLQDAWEKQEAPECVCNPDNPLWGPVLQWCGYKTENDCCNIKLGEKK